jgi:uncharacterized protein (DUF1684 family)
MNRLFGIGIILLLCACGGKSDYINSIEKEQIRRQRVFIDPELSPLDTSEIRQFKGLQFYPVNEHFRTEAVINWLPQINYLNMPQTGGDIVPYMQSAFVSFTIDDQSYQLPAYQTESMKLQHLLFVPFTDLTNGKETYNGGRYIDLPYVDNKRETTLDFNLSYTPYCAYTHRYSCPIVPTTNHLNLAITAGEKLQ